MLKYCDGGSFSGDVSEPVSTAVGPNHTLLFYRGHKIWKAVTEELLAIGMRGAQQALLAGCSAGGLAALLHCDQFRELLSKQTAVKCLGDGGFFIDHPDVSDAQTIRDLFDTVVRQHNAHGNLPKSCTWERDVTSSSRNRSMC